MRVVLLLSSATNKLLKVQPTTRVNTLPVSLNSGRNRLGKSYILGGGIQVPSFIQACSMTTSHHGPFTTPSGAIDMERYERMWNEPEPVSGVELVEGMSIQELLAKVKEQAMERPAIIKRQFVPLNKDGTNGTTGGSMLRIMQWNILADALCLGKDNFVRCPPEALFWPGRSLRHLEEILTHEPDILTLQEVDHFGFFKHALGCCGYEGHFFPKPDSPTLYVPENNGPDGIAIFIRRDVFELLKVEKIVLKTTPEHVDTNQVAIILHLRVRDTGKEVVVASTHLKAKPGWEKLRHSQGAYLASYLEEHVKDKPLIVSGDFNAEDTEPVYQVFSHSPLKLSSAYRDATGTDNEPLYTTWKIRGSSRGSTEREVQRTIDYIWYSRETLKMVSTLAVPTGEEIGEDRVPSYSYPSDHFSLAADFLIG